MTVAAENDNDYDDDDEDDNNDDNDDDDILLALRYIPCSDAEKEGRYDDDDDDFFHDFSVDSHGASGQAVSYGVVVPGHRGADRGHRHSRHHFRSLSADKEEDCQE
jgi:hypothetical protein